LRQPAETFVRLNALMLCQWCRSDGVRTASGSDRIRVRVWWRLASWSGRYRSRFRHELSPDRWL